MSKLVPGEVRRRDIPEYGMFSVRELITNAVCHRDYEDQGGKIIINVSNDTSLRLLSKLRFLGLIDKEGVGRGTYYVIK